MGASFANVQVRLAGDAAEGRVMAALRSLLVTPESSEVGSEAEADRTIALARSGNWVVVYDELSDQLVGYELEALAKGLSAALEAPAVTALVSDSDVLLMELFERGKRVASFDSNPAVSGRRRTKLKLDKWKTHLAPGHEASELAAVFAEKQLFAERTLENAAPLLGMDPQRACLGYRYQREETPSDSEPTSRRDGGLVLHLRQTKRPEYERLGTEPPHFVPASWSNELVMAVGQEFQEGFSVRNEQRASRGLSIVLRGPALEDGLVRLRHAQLVVGEVAKQTEFPEAPFTERSDQGGRIWVADFPELEIPAGPPSAAFEAELIPTAACLAAMYRAQIHANIYGDAVAVGAGELQIAFVPHEARETGQSGFSVPVDVQPQASEGSP